VKHLESFINENKIIQPTVNSMEITKQRLQLVSRNKGKRNRIVDRIIQYVEQKRYVIAKIPRNENF